MSDKERGLTTGPVVGAIIIVFALIGFFAVCVNDGDDNAHAGSTPVTVVGGQR